MSTIDNRTMGDADVEQHTLAKSVLLHLLPGVLILGFFVITAPLVEPKWNLRCPDRGNR